MKKILLAFFVVCTLCNSFGQNKKKDQDVDIVNHEVQRGESVRLISKKYSVDPADIYKFNKFAVEGITEGMILKIPFPRKEGAAPMIAESPSNSESTASEIISESTASETLAEKPSTSNTDIKKIVITERKTEINHKVVSKETLYSLAKDFNVSVDDIKASNPDVAKRGLQVGQIIIIPKEKSVNIQQSTSLTDGTSNSTQGNNEQAIPTPKVAPAVSPANTIQHTVIPKETFYSLSRKYNVTADEIRQQNKTVLKNGLQIGQILTIKINN